MIQFNLKLIETCVLETHGQISKDNEIRRDLIELYRAMKKPTMASALHLSPEWRQVIGKDMVTDTIKVNLERRLETLHIHKGPHEKGPVHIYQERFKRLCVEINVASAQDKQAQLKGQFQ